MFECYQKAAFLGNIKFMREVANCYLRGRGIPQDDLKALEWYIKIIGHFNAIFGIAAELYKTDKYRALKWYKVCEGEDDLFFLLEYLNYLDKNKFIDKNLFKIIQTKGVTNIPKEMKNYKGYSNYEFMKGFLFTRDADKNPASAVVGNIKDIWGVKLDRRGDFKIDSDNIKIGFFMTAIHKQNSALP